jgi:hypothetical protein
MNATVWVDGLKLSATPDNRASAASFHRWNGRAFLLTAFAASATSLYLVWSRGAFGPAVQPIGTSVDAVLIIAAVVAALQAIGRSIETRRGSMLRLFLVVSSVWFLRAGLMSWILFSMAPPDFNSEAFEGSLLDFPAMASYLLPLVALEIYLATKDGTGAAGTFSRAGGLLALTVVMGVGILGATMGVWLRHL